MTTKEIAEATGKTERSVRNWVIKLTEKSSVIAEKASASSPMNPADYNLEETCAIIEIGLGKNASDLFRMSANNQVVNQDKTNGNYVTKDDLILFGKTLVSETITQLMPQICKMIQTPNTLQIEAPKIANRDEFRRIMNKAAQDSGDYAGTYNTLYSEIYYRLHINARQRAKNQGVKAIDIIEAEDLLPEVIAIAKELFGIN